MYGRIVFPYFIHPATIFLRMCSPMNTRIPGLSRRALMSALGVSGFAVLLSACGEDSKPAGAATESSSSSSSATAVASASSSDSPSPSSNVSAHYSGKSKAPEGEYRPADFYGPAQNVPKPKAEEGYTNASLEGMRKTVQAWTEWRNYGMQTGDYSEARKFISKDFKDERDTYDLNTGLYKEGGWMIGGDLRKYEFHGEPINQGNGKYEWKFFVAWPYYVYVDSDGKTYKKIRNEDYENNWFMMTLHHDGNRWLIDNVHSLAIEKK